MKVLVLSPHLDDESLGCGGTLRRHVLQNDTVFVAFLTRGESAGSDDALRAQRVREAELAARVIGTTEMVFIEGFIEGFPESNARSATELIALIRRIRPSFVYAPHGLEEHPDHAASYRMAIAACRNAGIRTLLPDLGPGHKIESIRLFEVWTPLSRYNLIVDITATMAEKQAAIACYASQTANRHYGAAMTGLAQYRAEMAGFTGRHVEVFWEESLFPRVTLEGTPNA